MIEFSGTYFDGNSSRPYAVIIECDSRFLRIREKDALFDRKVLLKNCSIDPPLGRTTQTIRLPDGAVCEIEDVDVLSVINVMAGKNRGMRFVHFIESRWKLVFISLSVLVLFVLLFKVYAIPYFAREAAYAIPNAISEELSYQTMKLLDKKFLKPSILEPMKITELEEKFQELLIDMDTDNFHYRLEFRKSPIVGPNAFALPSGQIVITDELINLSESYRELEGILLHEIWHVQERHGLRMAIQNAGIFLIIAALLGDVTEISSVAASLPTILARSEYSREFEREADRFAALYFIRKGWDIKPMQDILQRITKNMPNFPGESVLSTHPVIQERIQYLKQIAEENLK